MPEVVFPCPEKSWDSLDGSSNESRFCKLCMKKVFAKRQNTTVYCGTDSSNRMSYQTFIARFTMILFFVFGSSLFSNVIAQNSSRSDSLTISVQSIGEIKGLIIDNESQDPLPFATVVLWNGNNMTFKTNTDFDGNYRMQVTPGIYQLEISYIGYETPGKIEVSVKQDQIAIVNQSLSQDSYPMLGIVIEPPYLLNDHRSKTFKREEINRHPNK